MIKEEFWALGDDFHILDESGNPVYLVDGEAFSWGDKLSFQDMSGREVAFISQRLFNFFPKYDIYRGGELFAEMTKEFSWFQKAFTLDIPGPNDYSINGSFWDHHYEFLREGQVVAQISKAVWSWNHCYGVDIIEGEDDISILCAAIVIDQILHDEQKR